MDRAGCRGSLRQVGPCPSWRGDLSARRRAGVLRGDAAFQPKYIIWAVAHGHDAAVSIDALLGEDVKERRPPTINLASQRWESTSGATTTLHRRAAASRSASREAEALKDIMTEVELASIPARFQGGATLPELRVPDRVRGQALHRMRCLRRHLPDGLHHLHRERRGEGAADAPQRSGRRSDPRISTSPTTSRQVG